MIKKWHDVYPSSNVSKQDIDDYGWIFLEDLPARINPSGNLSPIPEASQYLRGLRSYIDDRPTITLGTENGPMAIEDFAVAPSPTGLESSLGFFVLLARE